MSANHPFIAMLLNLPEGDREISLRREAFLQGVQHRKGLTVATRYGAQEPSAHGEFYDTYGKKAQDLGGMLVDFAGPDLYFASCWPTLMALRGVAAAGKKIVFAGAFDLSDNPGQQAKYGNNVYGFISYGKNLLAQWPGLLTTVAPMVKRAAVVYDMASRNGLKDNNNVSLKPFDAIQTAAAQLNPPLAVTGFDVASDTLVRELRNFANASGGPAGLIVPMSTLTATNRRTRIIQIAENLGLPAVYPNRLYTMDDGNGKYGGLISRGTYLPDLYRRAGGYADQILSGMLPTTQIDVTQTGTGAKFETVINLNAAKAIDLTIPPNVLAQADLVIGD
jgi:putative ABC transport system substrate-binding protein